MHFTLVDSAGGFCRWILVAGRWPGEAERVQAALAPQLPPAAEITVGNSVADPERLHSALRITIAVSRPRQTAPGRVL
jgi:hypothetical protein